MDSWVILNKSNYIIYGPCEYERALKFFEEQNGEVLNWVLKEHEPNKDSELDPWNDTF